MLAEQPVGGTLMTGIAGALVGGIAVAAAAAAYIHKHRQGSQLEEVLIA